VVATREIDFIPDRINEEPVVFLAMTNSEIKYAVMVCFGVWLPISLLFCFLAGRALLAFALAPALVFVSLWLIGKRLRVIKRGKPKQFHMLALRAWLQDHGLSREVFIRDSRTWDIKRWRTR